MIKIADNKTNLICGDALSVLKTLPDESIDTVVTSPPFWALRDYKIDPQVWDGDPNCEHDWESKTYRIGNRAGNTDKDTNPFFTQRKNVLEQYKSTNPTTDFCCRCGAWRGSLGLEPTFELYIKHLCDVFDEVYRVLKRTGCCFIDLGDTYFGSGGSAGHTPDTKNLGRKTFEYGAYPTGTLARRRQDKNKYGGKSGEHCLRGREFDDYQNKCLCMIPYRFAIEMINRGWILRNIIIWYKPNHMPSSVKDRFASSYEPVFMLTKSKKYYFDLDAVRVPHKESSLLRQQYPLQAFGTGKNGACFSKNTKGVKTVILSPKNKFNYRVRDAEKKAEQCPQFKASKREIERYKQLKEQGMHTFYGHSKRGEQYENPKGKNPGDLWRIPTQPFAQAHFATYPEKLIEPMIKAGCPEFVCKKCGKAREPILEPSEEYKKLLNRSWTKDTDKDKNLRAEIGFKANTKEIATTSDYRKVGYTDCGCNAGFEGGTVLDPFMGSGTTGVVSKRLNRKFIGVELKEDYLKMADKRIRNTEQELSFSYC